MNNSKKIYSCEEANNVDMVDYLSKIGFEPKRVSGHQYWYLSPFRTERTASFKINRNINCWYDFGEGKGGTLVDFGIRYFQCSVYDFLQQPFLTPLNGLQFIKDDARVEEKKSVIQITDVKKLSSLSLRNYLKERKINFKIADKYCREISFCLNDKSYFAIGFQNDQGGYELRNSFFKGSTHPKGITLLQNNGSKLNLFEGFFDFLSYKTITENSECVTEDYCVLNSLSFLGKTKEILPNYFSSRIFFDQDKKGIEATQELMHSSKNSVDGSSLYKSHKDFNQWLVEFGLQAAKPSHKQTKKVS